MGLIPFLFLIIQKYIIRRNSTNIVSQSKTLIKGIFVQLVSVQSRILLIIHELPWYNTLLTAPTVVLQVVEQWRGWHLNAISIKHANEYDCHLLFLKSWRSMCDSFAVCCIETTILFAKSKIFAKMASGVFDCVVMVFKLTRPVSSDYCHFSTVILQHM